MSWITALTEAQQDILRIIRERNDLRAEVESLRAEVEHMQAALPVTIEVSESLECDGGSVTARDATGRRLNLEIVARRRQYRTEYTTWRLAGTDQPTSPAGDRP